VAAGADAVYLGVEGFNARRGAKNFTVETLAEACRFAHLRGTKVYLTTNIVILPSEEPVVLGLIEKAWSAGIDAVIVQDLGLMRLLARELPGIRMHISTQVNAHSSDTVRALASLGASRITFSRELSLAEIRSLTSVAHEAGVETEAFVHGAICVCYSGQCLLSSMAGGRSANRGMCAQPCRLPYRLVDARGGGIEAPGEYLLSPKDLAGIDVLPELVATGVDSLKIEGRMKSPEYVGLVTGIYRGALDRAARDLPTWLSSGSWEVREGERSVLAEAFSRGFTTGHLTGERGSGLIGYSRPNNRGVRVGRIIATSPERATLKLEKAVDAGDTIEVWTSRGRHAQKIGPMRFGQKTVSSAPGGAQVSILAERPASVGDRVFRVRNAALAAAAERLYAQPGGRRMPVSVFASVVIGKPLEVAVTDASGRRGAAFGEVVEPARTKAVTAEEVAEHVGRLGSTAYEMAEFDCALSPGAGVGFSQLHRVRQAAVLALEQEVLRPWEERGQQAPRAEVPQRPETLQRPETPQRPRREAPRVVAVARDLKCARACLAAGADEVHVESWALGEARPVARTPGAAKQFGAPGTVGALGAPEVPEGIVPVVSRVCHDAEAEMLLAPSRRSGKAVAGSLGALTRLAEEGCSVQAHWSLNVTNACSVAQAGDMGAAFVWLSPELSLAQVCEIAESAGLPVGVAVAGRQEVMVTEHDIAAVGEGRGAHAHDEGRDAQKHTIPGRGTPARGTPAYAIKDRKEYVFPIMPDPLGRTRVYNSVTLDATRALPALIEAGVDAVRLDLEMLDAPTAAAEVSRVCSAVKLALAGRAAPPQAGETTTGHFFRGLA